MDFNNFDDLYRIARQANTFNEREVGITHPDNPAFIKISDNGDVEIFAGEGVGIILHPQNKSITFVADSVKFIVKDKGVRINDSTINEKARKFTEPVMIPTKFEQPTSMLDYTTSYLEDDYDYVADDKIIDPNTQLPITREEYKNLYGKDPEWTGEHYA
jgi:hypothetical protein